MAVTYGFYNSLNKDRVYNAEQMSSIFNGIITDGVFASIGGSLMPIAGTGMQVVVKTGKCWFNSTWTLNDALLPLDIPAADVSLTRIDAVVVEINSAISTRANTIKVIKGTPSANPAKPTLANTETLHQYALGYVTVGAGVTSITADKIEVNVGKTTCPFITSVLQQTDITALFNQWDAEFNAWFANVQAQLSGNVAANLQRQINEVNTEIQSMKTESASHLRAFTRNLLDLPENATPDDAFLALAIGGSGNYAFRVHVLYSNGEPYVGASLSGITAMPTKNLVTDANGIAFGKSSNKNVTITVPAIFDDVKSISKSVTANGTITDVEIIIPWNDKIFEVLTSKRISPSVSAHCTGIKVCAIGAGGSGSAAAYTTARANKQSCSGGTSGVGGRSGESKISDMMFHNGDTLQIEIGAGGDSVSNQSQTTDYANDAITYVSDAGKNGGATKVTLLRSNEVFSSVSASGGAGGGSVSAKRQDESNYASTISPIDRGSNTGVGDCYGGHGAACSNNIRHRDDEWNGQPIQIYSKESGQQKNIEFLSKTIVIHGGDGGHIASQTSTPSAGNAGCGGKGANGYYRGFEQSSPGGNGIVYYAFLHAE